MFIYFFVIIVFFKYHCMWYYYPLYFTLHKVILLSLILYITH